MLETPEELAGLQALLDRSAAASNPHLTSIVTPERRMSAQRLVDEATGIAVLAVASVTAAGEPRISAVDGHFRHGTWWFSTSSSALKARQWRARPAASAAWTPRDGFGVFAHGSVEFLATDDPRCAAFHDYLTELYGMDPDGLSEDGVVYLRLEPSWMLGFAADDLVAPQPGEAAEPTG
jgi:hypothetical protein